MKEVYVIGDSWIKLNVMPEKTMQVCMICVYMCMFTFIYITLQQEQVLSELFR